MRLIIIYLFSTVSYALNLGVVGSTFPIAEQSLIEFLYKKINLEEEQNKLKLELIESANRPKPLNLARINHTKTHFYKPIIVLKNDLLGANGEVLFKKGAVINALSSMSAYAPNWLFLDADDKAQMLFAKRILKQKDTKVILTKGEISKTEQELLYKIYFDQGGAITSKLKIEHVPALVTREKDALKIREIAISENGDEI